MKKELVSNDIISLQLKQPIIEINLFLSGKTSQNLLLFKIILNGCFITFRSLDDYKPPLYNYFAIVPIAVLGLNEFAVRFPSAFFGSLSIFGCYLLVKELFYKTKKEKHEDFVEILALLSSFFFAISPW